MNQQPISGRPTAPAYLKIRHLTLLLLVLIPTVFAIGQVSDPGGPDVLTPTSEELPSDTGPGGTGDLDGNPDSVPVDGGLSLLLAAPPTGDGAWRKSSQSLHKYHHRTHRISDIRACADPSA
jgi:hypothetical protein